MPKRYMFANTGVSNRDVAIFDDQIEYRECSNYDHIPFDNLFTITNEKLLQHKMPRIRLVHQSNRKSTQKVAVTISPVI